MISRRYTWSGPDAQGNMVVAASVQIWDEARANSPQRATQPWEANATAWLQHRQDAIDAAGTFLTDKFIQQCHDSGVEQAAKNLRKQGLSLTDALLLVRAL